jgi:hypothetical protein
LGLDNARVRADSIIGAQVLGLRGDREVRVGVARSDVRNAEVRRAKAGLTVAVFAVAAICAVAELFHKNPLLR